MEEHFSCGQKSSHNNILDTLTFQSYLQKFIAMLYIVIDGATDYVSHHYYPLDLLNYDWSLVIK